MLLLKCHDVDWTLRAVPLMCAAKSCLAPLSDGLAGSQAGAGPKKGSP